MQSYSLLARSSNTREFLAFCSHDKVNIYLGSHLLNLMFNCHILLELVKLDEQSRTMTMILVCLFFNIFLFESHRLFVS